MPSRLHPLWHGLRLCAGSIATLLCWAVWIALIGLFVAQIGIALSRELKVPAFVLRSLEERFAASGVQARLGRATFDSTGRVLLEDLRLFLPDYAEPVADLRAVYVELNPWLLPVGKLDARRVQATGVTFSVPAMLAPSGRSEELLSDLDIVVVPTDRELRVEHLVTQLAGVVVTAEGALQFQRERDADRIEPLPLVAMLARHYPTLSRQLIHVAEQVKVLDHPAVHLSLTPSAARGAVANVRVTARGLKLPQFRELEASDLVLTGRVPLLGEASSISPVSVTAAEVRLAGGHVARDVSVLTRGLLKPTPFAYLPREIEITARELAAQGFIVNALSARLEPSDWPRLAGSAMASYAGSPAAVHGFADFSEKSADVRFAGTLRPELLDPVDALLRRDLRRFINFAAPVELDVRVALAAGWKFERLAGRVAARQIDARGVALDAIAGEIDFDGRRFVATNTVARIGDNFARGTFEQDFSTQEFRFLLDGRLRPLAISGWFRSWWSNFFETLEFPHAPPDASVDVRGRWRAGHETTVFVFAESADAVIRGARFDYARTLLFIRPNFIDGLELFGTRGTGDLRGTFTRHFDLAQGNWRELTLNFDSTLDLENGAKLLGPTLAERLTPFAFEKAPQLKVIAHLEGPASPNGSHQTLRIRGESTGDFSFYRFPARNLSFDAEIRDREITLSSVEAEVATGILSGRARVWGPDDDRRLGFDASLRGASLGRAVTTVSEYAALRRGEQPSAADRFLPGKTNVRLDLALSAEGRLDDFYSYRGSGNAALEGPELGEVRLLGALSALLDFTALRFTSARAEFRLEGPTIIFPSVDVTGANSAIQAHGDYSLQRRQLDFNARIYPFHESKSLLQVVGAVLTPISNIFEVKLTGRLDQPKWAFVMGPTNLFRSLNPTAPNQPRPAGDNPPSKLAPTPPETQEVNPAPEKTH